MEIKECYKPSIGRITKNTIFARKTKYKVVKNEHYEGWWHVKYKEHSIKKTWKYVKSDDKSGLKVFTSEERAQRYCDKMSKKRKKISILDHKLLKK